MDKREVAGCVLLGAAVLAAGAYMLVTIFAPALQTEHTLGAVQKAVSAPRIKGDRLYIPKIGLNIAYAAGGPTVLNDRAWWRYPQRGNPQRGGNFILAGHRFQIGFSPGETLRKSPFYQINKLNPGDKIYIDFNGHRYEYLVKQRAIVKPDDVRIEAPSARPHLTLYSCTLEGARYGREVIIGTLIAKVV